MIGAANAAFRPTNYLSSVGVGRRLVRYKTKQVFYHQGTSADAVFYILIGRAKLTVPSKAGKEATVTLLAAGDFVGEESIAGAGERRQATASAITECITLRIDRNEMLRVLDEEHAFSGFFLKFILMRSMRTHADLVDQLFNSSERRLARTLLLMADYSNAGEPETLLPPISQQTLADMIGTTRSRVSFFMNRFRELGYIEYRNRIVVHKSLLNVVLRDQLPKENEPIAREDEPRPKHFARRLAWQVPPTEPKLLERRVRP